MLWTPRPLAAKSRRTASLLAGIDLNATRIRAVQGPIDVQARALALDDQGEELPLVISLEGRHPEIGQASLRTSRLLPHLVCQNFLGYVSKDRTWGMGRQRIDAVAAMSQAYDKVRLACPGAAALVPAVPAYLSKVQLQQLFQLAKNARLPWVGCVSAPLALSLAAGLETPWAGFALVIDVDTYALTASLVLRDHDQLFLQASESWPSLSALCWRSRLVDFFADSCIRQSRRDPRDCAQTEQHLYNELDTALAQYRQGKSTEILVRNIHWYQSLVSRPDELEASCQRLVQSTTANIKAWLSKLTLQERIRQVFIAHDATCLPGLSRAVQGFINRHRHESPHNSADLVGNPLQPLPATLHWKALDLNSVAHAAHTVAGRIHHSELAAGVHDLVLPLPHKDSEARRKRSFKHEGSGVRGKGSEITGQV
jgi:hypothetical protein